MYSEFLIDVFKIHDGVEDGNPRRLIKVVSAIRPEQDDGRSKIPFVRNFTFIMHELIVNLCNQVCVNRNCDILDISNILTDNFGHEYRNQAQKWLLGKSDIPLVALEMLVKMAEKGNGERGENPLCNLPKYVYLRSPNTHEFTRLPLVISNDLLYFIGVIIGDGCLTDTVRGEYFKRRDYRICLEVADKHLIENVQFLFHKLFNLNVHITRTKNGYWQCTKRNKPLVRFLNRIFNLPIGVKATNISIPAIVRSLPINSQIPFLTGILDTDLGLHNKSIGSNFASERFRDDLVELLQKLSIDTTTLPTYFKNGIYAQHELRISKHSLPTLWRLVEAYPLKNLNRRAAIEKLLGGGSQARSTAQDMAYS